MFYNEWGAKQQHLVGQLASAWAKLEAYAARFALLFHLVKRAAGNHSLALPNEIDETSVNAAIALTKWFGRETTRVYARLGRSETERELHRHLDAIQERGGMVTVRNWHRYRRLSKSGDALAELKELAEAGHGRVGFVPQKGKGRPSECFMLNGYNHDTDDNARHGSKTTNSVTENLESEL